MTRPLSPAARQDVLALWRYTLAHDDADRARDPGSPSACPAARRASSRDAPAARRAADLALALGCHDPAVADHAARLVLDGVVERLVISGATSPATRPLFPHGEAVHFARRALAAGVPAESMVLETRATNTAENFTRTRALLESMAIEPRCAVIVTRPYHERRALLTARHHWPGVTWRVTASEHDFDAYCRQLGDSDRVVNYTLGEVKRLATYGQRALLAPGDPVPQHLLAAAERLAAAGYAGRPVP